MIWNVLELWATPGEPSSMVGSEGSGEPWGEEAGMYYLLCFLGSYRLFQKEFVFSRCGSDW